MATTTSLIKSFDGDGPARIRTPLPAAWQGRPIRSDLPLRDVLPYTEAQDIYVSPWAYDLDPAELTRREREILAAAGAATLDQLNQMAEFGHYLGWRVGIRSDGTWIFFVAGD